MIFLIHLDHLIKQLVIIAAIPSTNIQKKVARWKYLVEISVTHQENSKVVLGKWMLCMRMVMIQQVLVRKKLRNKLEWILFLKHRISLNLFWIIQNASSPRTMTYL